MEAGTVESRFPSGAKSNGHFGDEQLPKMNFVQTSESARCGDTIVVEERQLIIG